MIMKKKRYPILDEEECVDMACEPIAKAVVSASSSANIITTVHDWIDNLDWDKFPSFGPSSEEEAIARIDKFEDDLANGRVKWITSEEMDRQLYEDFPWLR